MVSVLSGRYHLSKRDTTEIMADVSQANVSLGSVSALERRTSEAIRDPVEKAREYVQEQPTARLHETGWREANQRALLWVAATTVVTVFPIRLSQGGQVAKEELSQTFQCIVVSGRWSAYHWLSCVLRQLCWAYLLP